MYYPNKKNIFSIIFLMAFINGAWAQDQFKVLLYTRQDAWHYESIPTAIEAFRKMSDQHQFDFSWTQNADDLTQDLSSYGAVVFLNANADILTQEQLAGLKTYMNAGGGFVGIHACSNGDIRKPWFDKLIGGVFKDHPKLQTGIVQNVAPLFPSNLHLPEQFLWSDEWYNFTHLQSQAMRVVLTVDESSYDPAMGYNETPLTGMGKVHPVAWYQEYDGGRSFYTSLGHKPEVFLSQMFLDHIYGGLYWVVNGKKANNEY